VGSGRLPGPAGVVDAFEAAGWGSSGYDWEDGTVERRRNGLIQTAPIVMPRHPTWTTISAILTAFFAPIDLGERLWLMPETDSYTKIVRSWGPVVEHLDKLKREAVSRPLEWDTDHKSTSRWVPPTFGYVRPPNCGWDELIRKPPGTDSDTASRNLIAYMLTGYATQELHTSSIGSFRIMATADEVDVATRKIILDVWMYNEMSARSFGKFAHRWPFEGRPMRSQFMWWNWKEKFNFYESGNIEPAYRGNLAF
jgi:hypothetical protein